MSPRILSFSDLPWHAANPAALATYGASLGQRSEENLRECARTRTTKGSPR